MALNPTGGGSLLPSFQSLLNEALKAEGLVPMTTGITRPVTPANDYRVALADAGDAVDRAVVQFGSRAADRYSTGVGSSYRDQRFAMIASLENIRTKAYDDTGNVAIGLGFNMDKEGARDVWQQAFGDSLDFDAVRSGRKEITPAQAKQLFDHDVVYFERVVDEVAGDRPLSQNQRLALVSVAYTTPARVSTWAPVVQSGDDAAVADLILTKSFRPNHPYAEGLKNRRWIEASVYSGSMDPSVIIPEFDAYMEAVQVDPKSGTASINGQPVVDDQPALVSIPSADGRPALALPTPVSQRPVDLSNRPLEPGEGRPERLAPFAYDSISAGTRRNLAVNDDLVLHLQKGVTAVYGSDYRVSVYSGTQNPKRERVSESGRHDHGDAADVYVFDPNGRRLDRDELIPLAQHWLASGTGSVGFPSKSGHSMHLDLVGGKYGPALGPEQGRFWFYGTETREQRDALTASLNSGVRPSYAYDPEAIAAGVMSDERFTPADVIDPTMPKDMPPGVKAERALNDTKSKGRKSADRANDMLDSTSRKKRTADKVNEMLDDTAPRFAQVSVAQRPVPFSMPTPRPPAIRKGAAQIGGGQGRMVINGVGTMGVSGGSTRSVTPSAPRGILPNGKIVTQQQTKIYNPDTNRFEERTVWR